MKIKKLITMGLASVMAVSALGITAFAADNGVVYSYLNENGETVNVTEFQLAAEHWDTDFLEDTPPAVYADFPMSVDSFTSDLGEQYLDLVYMKKLQDFTAVHVKLTDADTQEVVYDEDLAINSFYSPMLEMGKRYVLVLTEDIGGATTTYQRYITTKTEGVELPEDFFTVEEAEENSDEEEAEENVILVASVDDIRSIQTVSDTGEIIIDSTQNVFDHVAASDFDDYCVALDNEMTYRVIAHYGNERYAGFIDGGSADIYIPQITVSDADMDNIYSVQTAPSTLPTYATVLSKASQISFSDNVYYITNSNYKAFKIDIASDMDGRPDEMDIITKSDVNATMVYYISVNGNSNPGKHTVGLTTSKVVNIPLSTYGTSDISIVGYVYLTTATAGTCLISPNAGEFNDDVISSIHTVYSRAAYNPTSVTSFEEHLLVDGNDMDIFHMKAANKIYKVDVRNRSIAAQNDLANGIIGYGSKEKVITAYSTRYRTNSQAIATNNVLTISIEAEYTIPKNADLSIYCESSYTNHPAFVGICFPSKYIARGDRYQIAYAPIN